MMGKADIEENWKPMTTSFAEYGSVSLGAEMAGMSHLMSAQLGWARVRDDSASAGPLR